MQIARWVIAVGCAVALAVTSPSDGSAQSLADRLKRKAEEAKKAAEAKKTAEEAAKAMKGTSDSAKAAPAAASPTAAPAPGAAAAPAAGGASAAAPADAKVWENYDFVPGSKVVFFSDFSDDRTGNFSRRLGYSFGPMEVVERDGVKVFRATGRSEFLIPVGKQLPDKFTLEADIIAPSDVHALVTFEGGPDDNRGAQSAGIVWMPSVAWIEGGGQSSPSSRSAVPAAMQPNLIKQVAHLRILMDGAYFKMYVNERRLYNIPKLPFRRDSVIRVMVNASEEQPVYLTSLRIAESETDVLYDALAAKGRWSTQGILFATGKADLQPESRPVLKEIAETLKQHEDLKVLIEGHTDNVGKADANLALSDARAAAVKAALVSQFGIAADRVTTKGFGDTRPTVPNATPEGRAQNRRVEVVKQ